MFNYICSSFLIAVLWRSGYFLDGLVSKFGQSPVQRIARPYSTQLLNNSLMTTQSGKLYIRLMTI